MAKKKARNPRGSRRPSVATAKKEIRDLGMRASYDAGTGEWRVAFPDNDEDTAYYTDSAYNAVATARMMALQKGRVFGAEEQEKVRKVLATWEHQLPVSELSERARLSEGETRRIVGTMEPYYQIKRFGGDEDWVVLTEAGYDSLIPRSANPCGSPRRKEHNMPRMTKARREFIDFLEDTLIPDLYESGTDATAETFEQLVAFMEGAEESHGQTRESFMDFLEYTLIPDMRESGTRYTANDLARGLRYLERDTGRRRNPRESNAALGHGRALTAKDKRVIDAFLDRRELASKKLSTDGTRLDGLWMGGTGIAEWTGDLFDMPDLGSRAADQVQRALSKAAERKWSFPHALSDSNPREPNGINRDGRAAIGAAIGGAVGGGYYGGLGGGIGAAAGSLLGAHMAELVGAVKGVGEGATKARRKELVTQTKQDVKELKKETREVAREKRAANVSDAARRVTITRRRR